MSTEHQASSTLPSPPDTPVSSQEDDLVQRLDDLLEQYLHQLDAYDTLRKKLQDQFSSGFFALANAQRHCKLGPGRRYGEEQYDGRMKAGRVVRTSGRGLTAEELKGPGACTRCVEKEANCVYEYHAGSLRQRCRRCVQEKQKLEDCIESTDRMEPEAKEQQHEKTPETVARPEIEAGEGTDESVRITYTPLDPIRWYGLLVPPVLRDAQMHFASAVSETMAPLIIAERNMAHLETKIAEVRESLGIQQIYEDKDNGDVGEGHDDTKVTVPQSKPMVTQSKSNPKRQSLVDRTSAPRSPLLKLSD